MNRRAFISHMVGGAALAVALPRLPALAAVADGNAAAQTQSDAAWKAKLTPVQYEILREEGTEPPFTSPLNAEHRAGTFACAGCGQDLFSSTTKFDSGTGWPSFYEALPGAIAKKSDRALILERTEYHCSRCGGHHGHVFDDGPAPTGLRHCNNGAVLTFKPAV